METNGILQEDTRPPELENIKEHQETPPDPGGISFIHTSQIAYTHIEYTMVQQILHLL